MDIKVEKAGIRFKNLDPEYAGRNNTILLNIGRIDKTKVLTVRVPFELYQRLWVYAKNKRVSMSDIVRKAIKEYLKEDDK